MSAQSTLIRARTFRNFEPPKMREIPAMLFTPRHEYPKELLAPEADTQGWDAASAVRLSQVNLAMEKDGVFPPAFNEAMTPDWTIDGSFGPWKMVRGGSGSIVFLRTPIPAATMAFSGKVTALEDASATIQVKLNYLPQLQDEVPPDPAAGDKNNLLTDDQDRSADDPAVVVQYVDWGKKPPPDMERALFSAALAKWFNANLKAFVYVFNVVSLNQVAKTPEFQWLKPTYTSYAYYDGPREDPNDDVAYFGALTMNGRYPEGLANQLPASAIPKGEGAALLIGMRLFLENMVLPGVQAAFPGSATSDFKVSNGNTSIQLARNLDMEEIKVGAVWYTPTAEEFTVQIIGDEIQTRSKIHVPISPGLDAYVTTETYYRVELVTKPDGTQTLGWVKSREAKKDHYFTKAVWVTVTEVAVAVIGALAAAVATYMLQGVLRLIVVIVIFVVAGIAAATPELVAKAITEGAAKALPSIKEMLGELLEPIEWPMTTGFKLARAELNGSLQLSGSFIPA